MIRALLHKLFLAIFRAAFPPFAWLVGRTATDDETRAGRVVIAPTIEDIEGWLDRANACRRTAAEAQDEAKEEAYDLCMRAGQALETIEAKLTILDKRLANEEPDAASWRGHWGP